MSFLTAEKQNTFCELGLTPSLVNALDAQGIKVPFPIQAATIPDAIARNLAPQYRIMVWIGFWTGMRPSEVLGLTWGQLDFEEEKIIVDRQISRDTNQVH